MFYFISTLTKTLILRIVTFYLKILRKMYGPTKENEQWRIKTNEELRTKYESQDIVTVINIRRLEWLGHVSRMNETGSVKKILKGNQKEEEVEDDLDSGG